MHDFSMHGHNCDKGEIWYVRVGTKHVYYKVLTQIFDGGIQCEMLSKLYFQKCLQQK